MSARRGGFTMAELIVVVVLGSIVLLASLQVLTTQQRAYTAQNVAINGQQSTRMALEILSNELRELSPEGGDILSMSATQLQVRLMRKFSVVCGAVFGANPQLYVDSALAGSGRFVAGDAVFVWADNEVDTETDDHWIEAVVTGVNTSPVTCPANGEPALRLDFTGQGSDFDVTTDSVTMGAPVRSYRPFTFGLMTYNGDTYLGQRDGATAWTPIAGPLQPTNGLQLIYLDELDAVTAVSTDVRQIDVRIRASTRGVLNSVGNLVSDSIAAWVYTRN